MLLSILPLVILLPYAKSHSWVERLNVVVDGYVRLDAPGFPRANVLRSDPSFQDSLMTYELPPDGRRPSGVFPTDNICMPSQSTPEQGEGSPRLGVKGGQTVVLQYNENGHITKPWNNAIGKTSPGQVYVYGTNQSQPSDSLLSIHKVWTTDGSGGDRRGQLLYNGPFDDKKCYQYTTAGSGYSAIAANRAALFPGPGSTDPAQGENLWCKATVVLPDLEPSSVYTLYWVWDWPFEYPVPQPLVYTTCMDLDVEV